MSLRRTARRYVPYALRWRARLLWRRAADLRSHTRLAERRSDSAAFPHLVCRYERPLICYAGQEANFTGKRRNVELALAGIDGLVIASGETFSLWHCVGRPTQARGYQLAAALRESRLTAEVGGAICLVSTLLYNIALLSGMTIVERRGHSVDSYGDRRYFELGRDAAVEHPYLDLRSRNDLGVPVLLRAWAEEDRIAAEAWSEKALDISIEIDVATEQSNETIRARTRRTITLDGRRESEDLGWSEHIRGDRPLGGS